MMSPISRIGLLRHWQKARGGGELKEKAENDPKLKYGDCYWNDILCFTLQSEVIGDAFLFFSFVLDVDSYKNGRISCGSSELHGSFAVMVCIKLSP